VSAGTLLVEFQGMSGFAWFVTRAESSTVLGVYLPGKSAGRYRVASRETILFGYDFDVLIHDQCSTVHQLCRLESIPISLQKPQYYELQP